MKALGEMTQAEVAAFVQSHLAQRGIQVLLSGGAAAAFYSNGRYASADIDLINDWQSQAAKEKAAMTEIGFREVNRYFEHPETDQIIEILPGPPSLGDQPAGEPIEIQLPTGLLRILSATDCVKDRLAWYFYSADTQALAAALAIAQHQELDFKDLEHWAQAEGMLARYQDFLNQLDQPV